MQRQVTHSSTHWSRSLWLTVGGQLALQAPDLQRDSSHVNEPMCLYGRVCAHVCLSMHTHVKGGEREQAHSLGACSHKQGLF